MPDPRHLLRSHSARVVGTVVGLILFIAAAVAILGNQGVLDSALAALRAPHPATIASLAGLLVLNIVLSAIFFQLLMSRFGTVHPGEMLGLIAATTLLNYLPLRPGLLGRVAYHKSANNIRVRDTARTVVESLVITATLAVYLALGTWCASVGAPGQTWVLWAMIGAPIPVLFGTAVFMGSAWRPLILAAGVRHLELVLWGGRYILAFRLLGETIAPATGVSFACAGVISTMVPLISNGLGLREWAIGLLTPWLAGVPLELGLAAELVNRAAEIAIVVPAGLIGLGFLVRLNRKRGLESAANVDVTDTLPLP